jgi:pimeloyl-ACP methyl ester carboxylesterase
MSMRLLIACTVLAASAFSSSAQAPRTLFVAPGVLPPAKNVEVFSQKIAYYDVGTGPAVVLVHGFGSQASVDWGHVIRPLAAHHRVIALDQIGWGQSDKPTIDYDIQTFVDFLGEFLRTLKVEHFALAGESLGGWVVASYTIQALGPGNTGKYAVPKPEKLILEDAAGHKAFRSDGPSPLISSLKDGASIASILYDKSLMNEEAMRENFAIKLRANDGATQRLFRANMKVESETVGDKVATITIPTLVVWGADDPIVPLADGKDFAAKIPGAKLVIVPQCGHAPSIEQPAEFMVAVESFLK